ncbi:MAG TPA: nuclear transport factor 2 family protein [Polyangiaceae bacterium]
MERRLVAGLFLAFAVSACAVGPEPPWQPLPPAPAPSPELTQRTRDLYAAITSGDTARAGLFYSQQPGRSFVGLSGGLPKFDGALQLPSTDELFIEPGTLIVPGAIAATIDRDAGWVVDTPTFKLKNGTELRCRLTLVWRNEYGIWKIVHSHASLAAGANHPTP